MAPLAAFGRSSDNPTVGNVFSQDTETSPLSTTASFGFPQVRGVHWEYLVPIASVHALALLAFLPWCFSWSGFALAMAGLIVFGTFGINLCYHRLLAHRSHACARPGRRAGARRRRGRPGVAGGSPGGGGRAGC